jgi:hypothetical protein
MIDDHPKGAAKKIRISHPGDTQSPHFPRLDLIKSKPTPMERNPLNREAAARGLPPPAPREAEYFAVGFTNTGNLLESFGTTGEQKPIPRIPGDQTQKRHGLIQPTTPSIQTPEVTFDLAFARVKKASYGDGKIKVQLSNKRLRFCQNEGQEALSFLWLRDVMSVKVCSSLELSNYSVPLMVVDGI